MTYRANFINSMISSFGWGLFSIASIVLLTSKSSTIFGWKREEVFVLTASYAILIGIFHLVFSRNFDRLSEIIHFGQLDTVLIKPIDSQFLISFYWVNYTSIFRIVLGIIFNIYLFKVFHFNFSLLNFIYFLILILVGLIVLYSIWFIASTLLIWFTRLSNLIDFLFNITGLARYPGEMIRQLRFYIFLFLLPITLIITVPAKFYLQKGSLSELILLLFFAVILFFASRKFWKFALRYYTSASG